MQYFGIDNSLFLFFIEIPFMKFAAWRRKFFTENKENSFFFPFFKTNFISIILKTKYLKKNGRIHLLFIDFGAKAKIATSVKKTFHYLILWIDSAWVI